MSGRVLIQKLVGLNLRDKVYMLFVLGYSSALFVYYLLYGLIFQFLPAVFFLCTVPLMALLGYSKAIAKEWTPFVTLLLSYEALQGTAGSMAASRGVLSIYQVDKVIWGFNLTGWVQSTFFSQELTRVALLFYTLHFPLVAVTSAVVWYSRRRVFNKYATAMVLTSYAALVTFILLPTAPPWFEGTANDLVNGAHKFFLSGAIASLTSLIESDKFAAFPSLHAAYAVIFAYFMFRVKRVLGFVALPVTLGILFSTLYLGQHYLVDLMGGSFYAVAACLISERFVVRFTNTD